MALLLVVTPCVAQLRPITPQDVLAAPEIAEVQLAPDGRHVAYSVRVRDLLANRVLSSFWLVPSTGGTADSLSIDQTASRLRWRPDGGYVSFLAPSPDGTRQVWEYTPGSDARQVTSHPRSVASYEWSPDGRYIAFTSSILLRDTIVAASMIDAEGAGVIIDRARFYAGTLLSTGTINQKTAHYPRRSRTELWIHDIEIGRSELVSDAVNVRGYAWSPDASKLAITGRDLLLYTRVNGQFEVLEAGTGGDYWDNPGGGDNWDNTSGYQYPFWSPDGGRIGFLRRDLRHRWAALSRLGVYSLADRRTTLLMSEDALETYGPRMFWLTPDTILVENTFRAGRRLFAIAVPQGCVRPIVDRDDWFDHHTFSRDGQTVAFTRERIDLPVELYVSERAFRAPRQLTSLQRSLARVAVPRVERLSWVGVDGVEVEGWLYLPSGKAPFPTLVFVHGGPTWVFGNRYEPYISIWPHAFSVFAARGIAVLVPNYRGTGSYGKPFRQPSALDAEPVTDIIAGVDTLISRGIADPTRLGIAGHSHGGWLGSLVAVRDRRFVAGSFAEGVGDLMSLYMASPGSHNLNLVEWYWGAGSSPYESPERYQEQSPVYGLAGLRMATLFEHGDGEIAPLLGLAFATAAWRAGMPHEWVLYRGTGHNIHDPRVMLEAMERNLDWFEFWLLGRRDPDPGKMPQYRRWEALHHMHASP